MVVFSLNVLFQVTFCLCYVFFGNLREKNAVKFAAQQFDQKVTQQNTYSHLIQLVCDDSNLLNRILGSQLNQTKL